MKIHMGTRTSTDSPAVAPSETAALAASPLLPVDIWSIVLQYLAAPLTQFISSPTAAVSLNRRDQILARRDLIRAAHVNKAAYFAARPFLYGDLYLFLRTDPSSYELPKVQPLQVEEPTELTELNDARRINYSASRAGHHAARSIFAPVCCAKCTRNHVAREMIEKVSEVPELFPFVVRGGKLYLPSLLANESQATRTPEAIGKSVATLLSESEHDHVLLPQFCPVEIVDGLVLVPYPLYLVSGLHIHSGDVSLSSWLAVSDIHGTRKHDWAAKLGFISALPVRKLTSLTLIVNDENDRTAFATLSNDLFHTFPHALALDIVTNLWSQSNFSPALPNNTCQVIIHTHTHAYEMETPVVPLALANAPIRRVEIYGLRSFIVQDWQHVFNHPTMHSLVLDFMLRTADLNQQPPTDLTAPALKSFTINCNLALDAFPRLDQPMYSALEELTLVHANWGFMSTTSDPTRWDQVPAIPFAHLPTLRKFSVLSKHLEQNVWINIRPEVLIGLLELPRLQHLSLPHVLPYFFLAPFAPALIRCDALHSLDVGTSLFCDMLSSVELPNLLSLMLRTTYIVEPDHQLSPKLWQRIHDRWGSQLVHFGYRCLSCELNPTPPCTFPPDFAFPKLRTIDIFKFVGTFDLSHISSFAPNLDRATINADHVSNLPALLTHPTLTHLQLAGPRCPTMLEALLTYPPLATLHLSLVPRATPGLLGRHSTAIGRECTRTSVTLTYDRERNGHVWQMLARSVHLGQFRHWINDAGGEHEDDVDEQNEWQATVVVPADLQLQEASWIESVVGGVLAEWKGVKVRVGVGQGEGGNVPEVAVMLIEVIKLQLRSAAASIEWVGQVEEPAAGGHKRVC